MSSEALERAARKLLQEYEGVGPDLADRMRHRNVLSGLLAEVARLEQERDEAHANTNEGLQWLRDDIAVKVATIASLEAALAVARERGQRQAEALADIADVEPSRKDDVLRVQLNNVRRRARAALALVDELAAATLAEPEGVTGPVEASAIRQSPDPGSASAAADEPGETP